jgi:DNA polymerase III alpha subunit (gram-positive type)
MLDQLHAMKIANINELNSCVQCEELYKRQFSLYALAYARSQKSIKDIYRLVSQSSTTDLYRIPRIFKEWLDPRRHNLIIACSPTDGEI